MRLAFINLTWRVSFARAVTANSSNFHLPSSALSVPVGYDLPVAFPESLAEPLSGASHGKVKNLVQPG